MRVFCNNAATELEFALMQRIHEQSTGGE